MKMCQWNEISNNNNNNNNKRRTRKLFIFHTFLCSLSLFHQFHFVFYLIHYGCLLHSLSLLFNRALSCFNNSALHFHEMNFMGIHSIIFRVMMPWKWLYEIKIARASERKVYIAIQKKVKIKKELYGFYGLMFVRL